MDTQQKIMDTDQVRRDLKIQLVSESKLVSVESLVVLKDLEKLTDV